MSPTFRLWIALVRLPTFRTTSSKPFCVGEEEIDGKKVDRLRTVDFSGRQKVDYCFSRDTGLLIKKEWEDVVKNEKAIKEQYYQKYAPVSFADGSGHTIQMPKMLEIHVGGKLDTTRTFNEISFNTGLADDFFEKPPEAKRTRL